MMENLHLEFLVEEPSMEAFLNVLLPRLFPDCTFRVHAFQGKERILQNGGYFKNGLRKVEAARTIAAHINPACNRSYSFVKFHYALIEAMA